MGDFLNCGVNRWQNTVTGKSYVGSSSDIPARKRQHLSRLRRGKHHSIKLQRSWNKHGAVAFKFEVLANCLEEDLLRQEQTAIDAFDAYRTGYNTARYADAPTRGRKASEEEKLARSIAQLGRKVSEETGRAISRAKKGKSLSLEHRQAIAASSTKSTEESKQVMRAAWNSHTPEFKAWLVRKGAATRWGNLFNEPKPAPLETTICCA